MINIVGGKKIFHGLLSIPERCQGAKDAKSVISTYLPLYISPKFGTLHINVSYGQEGKCPQQENSAVLEQSAKCCCDAVSSCFTGTLSSVRPSPTYLCQSMVEERSKISWVCPLYLHDHTDSWKGRPQSDYYSCFHFLLEETEVMRSWRVGSATKGMRSRALSLFSLHIVVLIS